MSQATRAYTPCVQTLTLQGRCNAPRVTWPWRALLPTLLQRAKGMFSWAFSEGPRSVPALPRLWGHWSYPPRLWGHWSYPSQACLPVLCISLVSSLLVPLTPQA